MLEINSADQFMIAVDAMPLLVKLTMQLEDQLENDRGVGDPRFNEDRKYARHRCKLYGIVECAEAVNRSLNQQGCSKVIIGDLSRNGFGIFAPEQWYPSQVVRLSLPIGQSICEVARARYHRKECYEIGLCVRKLIKYPEPSDQNGENANHGDITDLS